MNWSKVRIAPEPDIALRELAGGDESEDSREGEEIRLMVIALNGTCTMYCNLLTDIRIAREIGYDAIEIIGSKLYRYLDRA